MTRASRLKTTGLVGITAVAVAGVAFGAQGLSSLTASTSLTAGAAAVAPAVLPERQDTVAAGKLERGTGNKAARTAQVAVAAAPLEAGALVSYKGTDGASCYGFLGNDGFTVANCPPALNRSKAEIYIEGFGTLNAGEPEVAYGFVPAGADALRVTDSAGLEEFIPLTDGGQKVEGRRFFLTNLSLTKDVLRLAALDKQGRVVAETAAGRAVPVLPPDQSPSPDLS